MSKATIEWCKMIENQAKSETEQSENLENDPKLVGIGINRTVPSLNPMLGGGIKYMGIHKKPTVPPIPGSTLRPEKKTKRKPASKNLRDAASSNEGHCRNPNRKSRSTRKLKRKVALNDLRAKTNEHDKEEEEEDDDDDDDDDDEDIPARLPTPAYGTRTVSKRSDDKYEPEPYPSLDNSTLCGPIENEAMLSGTHVPIRDELDEDLNFFKERGFIVGPVQRPRDGPNRQRFESADQPSTVGPANHHTPQPRAHSLQLYFEEYRSRFLPSPLPPVEPKLGSGFMDGVPMERSRAGMGIDGRSNLPANNQYETQRSSRLEPYEPIQTGSRGGFQLPPLSSIAQQLMGGGVPMGQNGGPFSERSMNPSLSRQEREPQRLSNADSISSMQLARINQLQIDDRNTERPRFPTYEMS